MDKQAKKKPIGKSRKMMGGSMLSDIIAIIFLIGLVLALVPEETIRLFLGNENSIVSTIGSALIGSVTLIPAFVAFPLVGSFVDAGGASIVPGVAS